MGCRPPRKSMIKINVCCTFDNRGPVITISCSVLATDVTGISRPAPLISRGVCPGHDTHDQAEKVRRRREDVDVVTGVLAGTFVGGVLLAEEMNVNQIVARFQSLPIAS